jgi:hypothetical protein
LFGKLDIFLEKKGPDSIILIINIHKLYLFAIQKPFGNIFSTGKKITDLLHLSQIRHSKPPTRGKNEAEKKSCFPGQVLINVSINVGQDNSTC